MLKNNIKRRALSIVLTLAMVLTSVCSLSIVTNAAGGGSNGIGGNPGMGSIAWQITGNVDFILSIKASSITDDTSTSNMALQKVRYGNGVDDAMDDYPLYMVMNCKSMSYPSHNTSFNTSDYNDNDDKGTASKLYGQLKTEYNTFKNTASYRSSHSNVFTGYNSDVYDGIHGIRNLGSNNKTVYLEDIIKKVMDAYTGGKISYYDMHNFWYFYTRFAAASNQDWGKNKNTAGTRIGAIAQMNYLFIKGDYAVQKSADRMKWMQSGYLVALYMAYGDGAGSPYAMVRGSSATFQKSTKGLDNTLWSNETNNKFKSFTVEKLMTEFLSTDGANNNSMLYKSTLLSLTGYSRLIKLNGCGNSNNYMREYEMFGYGNGPFGTASDGPSLFWGLNMDAGEIVRHFYPARASGTECTVNGKSVYTGWAYYEVVDGSSELDNTPPFEPSYPNIKNIGTSIQYNAYLAGSDNTNYTIERGELRNVDKKDSFANNGHVMSDIVYVSDPVGIEDIYKVGDYEIKSLKNYLSNSVNSSIKLSAPVAETQYILKELSYRITDAGGSTELIGKTGVTTGTSTSVKGEYINKAYNDGLAKVSQRKHDKISNKGIQAGKCKLENGSIYYYYIYKRGTDGGSLEQYKTSDGKLYTTGGYKNADGSIHSGLPDYFSNKAYNKDDLVEKSSAYWYIKFPSGQYIPAVYENGNWYLCPVVTVNNILVQFRADYVADFTEGTTNYSNTYKSANMPEYLLAQNNETSDFTKKTLYTMIDDYSTAQWGSIRQRGYFYQNNTTIGNTEINSADKYQYSRGSLMREQSPYATGYIGDYGTGHLWNQNDLTLEKTDSYKGGVAKVQYIEVISHNIMNFINSTNSGSKFTNSNLPLRVVRFTNDFNTNGTNKNTLVNGSLNNTGNVYFTDAKDRKTIIQKITGIKSSYTTDELTAVSVPTFYSEGLVRGRSETSVNIANNIRYQQENNRSIIITNSEHDTGYKEWYFTKVLSTYKSWVYTKKSAISASSTPYIASWVYAASALDNTVEAGVTKLGLKSKYGMSASTKGKSITAVNNVKSGFYRFGSTEVKVTGTDANGNSVTRINQRRVLNNNGRPAGTIDVIGTAGVNASLYQGWIFNSTNVTLPSAYTQSSYDVPLIYNTKVHDTNSISKQVKTQTYSKSGNSVSLSWQHGTNGTTNTMGTFLTVYPEVRMWAENNKTSSPSDTTTYTSVTTVGAKPRYIPAMTYTTAKFNDLKADVSVIGTAVAYDTRAKKLALALGTDNTQVLYSGTAINGTTSANAGGTVQTYVFDFRAGGKTADGKPTINGQPVKDSWGNGGYKAVDVASAAMNKMLSNFEVSQSSSLAIYNGKNSNDGYQKIDIGSSVFNGALTAGTASLDPIIYNVYLSGGKVSKVIVKARDGFTICTYEKIKNGATVDSLTWGGGTMEATRDAISTTNLTDNEKTIVKTFISSGVNEVKSRVNTVLSNMKMSDIANNVFEHDTGVTLPTALKNSTGGTKSYNEDCSVLQIRSYTASIVAATSKATFAEQIPINLGPQTPADKNKYFSNGYKGFVNTKAEIKVKNTISGVFNAGAVITSAESKHKKKGLTDTVIVNNYSTANECIPDFIIGDVPISEALNG